jgi:hypothetical protein
MFSVIESPDCYSIPVYILRELTLHLVTGPLRETDQSNARALSYPEDSTQCTLYAVDQFSAEGLEMSTSGPTPNKINFTCRMPEHTKRIINHRIQTIQRSELE